VSNIRSDIHLDIPILSKAHDDQVYRLAEPHKFNNQPAATSV
jgi:hypothetical protein